MRFNVDIFQIGTVLFPAYNVQQTTIFLHLDKFVFPAIKRVLVLVHLCVSMVLRARLHEQSAIFLGDFVDKETFLACKIFQKCNVTVT